MSQSNCNIGVNLATLQTGNNTQANVNSPATFFIAPNAFYTQVTTCTAAQNSLTLPINPILGQTYTIRNDGSGSSLWLWPSTTTSTIDSTTTAGLGTSSGIPIAPNGGFITLIAVSNNGVANNASGANPYNNPAIAWHGISEAPAVAYINIGAGTPAQNISGNASGAIVNIPAVTANTTLTIPLPQAGLTYKFILTANATNTCTIGGVNAAGLINGVLTNGPTANTPYVRKAAANSVVFGNGCLLGDYVSFYSDGTNWYVNGASTYNTAGNNGLS